MLVHLLLPLIAAKQDPPMVTMQLVVLEAGLNQSKRTKEEEAKAMVPHLAYLQSLQDKGIGKAIGPLAGHDWRGLTLLDVKTPEEALKAISGDPEVSAKRLTAKVYTWYFGRPAGLFEKRTGAFTDVEPLTIGFLMRPKNAPNHTGADLKDIQAGHMANIKKMAESGLLVTAGPVGPDSPFRGIFLWRTNDQAKIKEMLKGDTAIQKNRLECKLATWYISKGLVPAK